MRFTGWNVALAAWLLISAFALGHSVDSAALTGVGAVLVGTFSLAAAAVPALRFANSGFALVLAWAALLMPEVTLIARVNGAAVAAAAFALSVIPDRSAGLASAQAPRPG